MNERQALDTHSRNFFFSGLLISRFNHISSPVIALASFMLSSSLYLAGYITWLLSINHAHNSKEIIIDQFKSHYESQYKHLPQYFVAAILGSIASAVLISSFWLPATLGIASCWLFFASNSFWWWAEKINVTRLQKSHQNSPLLSARENYFSYATLTTLNSALVAINVTLYLFVPAIALPLGLVLSTFLLALNIHTLHFWVKNIAAVLNLTEADQEEDSIELSLSYAKLQQRADFSPQNIQEVKFELAPSPQNLGKMINSLSNTEASIETFYSTDFSNTP